MQSRAKCDESLTFYILVLVLHKCYYDWLRFVKVERFIGQ